MIHLLFALLHVIVSLARNLEPAFKTNAEGIRGILRETVLDAESDLADLLWVAPLLSRRLERRVLLPFLVFMFQLSQAPRRCQWNCG
jgi:hypothetical protein